MSPQLQPAPQLLVMSQQEVAEIGREDPRRSRDVAGQTATLEAAGPRLDERAHPRHTRRLVGMRGEVALQQSEERLTVQLGEDESLSWAGYPVASDKLCATPPPHHGPGSAWKVPAADL